MRQRHDFYTLCPSCETRVSLTLAARLQAARHGTTCHCPSCQNEWNCIQEWVYRDAPDQFASQPMAALQSYEPQQPATHAAPMTQHPAHTQSPAAMPRPHMLPTYQPPQHAQPPMPAAQQPVQPGAAASSGSTSVSAGTGAACLELRTAASDNEANLWPVAIRSL